MTPSWQLRAYLVVARYFHKPLLALVGWQPLARVLFDLNAWLSYERPAGLRHESTSVGGVPGEVITLGQSNRPGTLLFLHGGAFVIGSVRAYRHLVGRIAEGAGMRAFAPDYRLAPEHPFPAALDDTVAVYRALCAEGPVALCGDSAGGGLALALLHRIGELGLPMPSAVAVMSPITDLTLQSPSLSANRLRDPLISERWGLRGVAAYLAGQDPSNPRISPLYGRFDGAPPVLIQVAEGEVLHDDSLRMAETLRAQGGTVSLRIWPHVPHVWHLMSGRVPEAAAGIAEVAQFLARPPAIGVSDSANIAAPQRS